MSPPNERCQRPCCRQNLHPLLRPNNLLLFHYTNPVYPLCGANGEDHDHLFFQCPFSSKVWTVVLTKCNANWQSTSWLGLIEVVTRDFLGKSLATIIKRLGFCCTVY
ncbi:unnamed protein product [Camellia sinensis]